MSVEMNTQTTTTRKGYGATRRRRFKPTPEQQAKAKERRDKAREMAKRISKMSEEERRALVQDWPTTLEGHPLSTHNACMIAYQGGATVIGGFRQWKKHGRFVKKGAVSKVIWVPIGTGKERSEETGEVTETGERTGFVLASVFDISQTEEMRRDDASGQPLYTPTETSEAQTGRVNVMALVGCAGGKDQPSQSEPVSATRSDASI